MRLEEFDFDLPERLIALRPAEPRSAARLLLVDPSGAQDRRMVELPELLRPGDALVFNNTRVIPARLEGVRRRADSAARIRATLTERLGPQCWRALAQPAKRLRLGDVIAFGTESAPLSAEVLGVGEQGAVDLGFPVADAALDREIERVGTPPLPPYIAARRESDARDLADYQTVFARHDGAVAAPTAALHFDEPLLGRLAERGVERIEITLHVGPGTFLPVKADDPRRHRMHAEIGELDEAAARRINAVKERGGRIIAVGTTALRVLETAAIGDGRVSPWRGATDLFVLPGYEFLAVDGLLTNFHLPRSTLFMLVCALMGRDAMVAAYRRAIELEYRFYSYGDASLLLPGRSSLFAIHEQL